VGAGEGSHSAITCASPARNRGLTDYRGPFQPLYTNCHVCVPVRSLALGYEVH
jgi:hypothetical protein